MSQTRRQKPNKFIERSCVGIELRIVRTTKRNAVRKPLIMKHSKALYKKMKTDTQAGRQNETSCKSNPLGKTVLQQVQMNYICTEKDRKELRYPPSYYILFMNQPFTAPRVLQFGNIPTVMGCIINRDVLSTPNVFFCLFQANQKGFATKAHQY